MTWYGSRQSLRDVREWSYRVNYASARPLGERKVYRVCGVIAPGTSGLYPAKSALSLIMGTGLV